MENHMQHKETMPNKSMGMNHHQHMVADYRRRFIVSAILTIPILLLSPLIQNLFRLNSILQFPGDAYVLFGLSTVVFFYGGWPFLKGIYDELKARQPGMMTLIALAITVSYIYSTVVVFGLTGMIFFWELATLIDVMLLGHWIEMKSTMGASRALEELAKLMPSEAHRITSHGKIEDVAIKELVTGDKILVKPGEKYPADGIITEGQTSSRLRRPGGRQAAQ